jgi:hypothetical protein
MAMPSPPLVRSLLVGSDPQDAAGLHREVADDRRFKVNGWMHQSSEKARQICQNGKADQRRTIGLAIPLDSIRRLIQRLVPAQRSP